MRVVKLPTLLWYGDKELSLEFPEEWSVDVYQMDGHDAPALSDQEVKAALVGNLNSKSIRMLAEGREECAIVVDDMTRPTRAYQLVPHILEELIMVIPINIQLRESGFAPVSAQL